jgi:uracil-DNA glycosylase family 4
LLVLGSGPTRDEVKAQEPLAGYAGKEMVATLEEAGIQKDLILVANAYACTPKEPRQDKEERLAVACCRPLLRHFVAALPATTPTLLAGKWARLAMTGKEKGLFSNRGFVDMKWDLGSDIATEAAPEEPEVGPNTE